MLFKNYHIVLSKALSFLTLQTVKTQIKYSIIRPLVKLRNRKIVSYFSTKTYIKGTQNNRLNETVVLSTQNICLIAWVRKYLQFYAERFC